MRNIKYGYELVFSFSLPSFRSPPVGIEAFSVIKSPRKPLEAAANYVAPDITSPSLPHAARAALLLPRPLPAAAPTAQPRGKFPTPGPGRGCPGPRSAPPQLGRGAKHCRLPPPVPPGNGVLAPARRREHRPEGSYHLLGGGTGTAHGDRRVNCECDLALHPGPLRLFLPPSHAWSRAAG